eukprot:gene10732-7640_t
MEVKSMLPRLRRKQDDVHRAYFKSTYHNLLADTALESPADLLIRRIRGIVDLDLDRRNQFYANYACMIQGPGSGKSRLVKECSKEFYVVHLCLRPEDSSGVPPRSELAPALLALAKTITKDNSNDKIDQFFAAMFHVIASKVAPALRAVESGCVSPQALWKYIVEENSANFAADVQQTLSSWGDGAPKSARGYMMEALRALDPSQYIPIAPTRFLVVLDEVRPLLEPCPKAPDSSLFLLLVAWMNRNISREAFFLLLDTTSRAATHFRPPSPIDDPSGRIAYRGTKLH